MTRNERNRLARKHDHARRCPNCGEKITSFPIALKERMDLCKDCFSVMQLINARMARYTQRQNA